ncbi:serine protease 27 [Sarotherodon galilaeus]
MGKTRMRSAFVFFIHSYTHGRKSMAATENDKDESASLNETGDPELVSKNDATSVVWNWFGFCPSDTHQSPILCRTCKRAVVAKGANTTNLFHHLKQKHFLYSKLLKHTKIDDSTINVALKSCTPHDKSSKRWGELTNAVTRCLARDMMPIQSVERKGFKKMLKTFDPRYRLPTKKYFSKFFASTMDTWSSRTSDLFMSLTMHYVDKDWKLQNKCFERSFFPEDHTGENIAKVLKEFLSSWNLQEEKEVCVTTDNGANIVKAAAQKELGLPEHKLITECCTCWGSKQRMIQRPLEQEKAITQVLAADKTTRHLMLTWKDIEVLDSVSTALSPLLEFTDAFSAEEYVTISCVKPVLQIDTELTKDIKTAKLDYINKIYKDSVTERLVNMASFLDPCFHTEYFSESESEVIKVQGMSELEHLVSHQGTTATGFSETPHTSAGDQTSQGAVKKPKKNLLSELSSYVNSPPADSEYEPLFRLARKCLCIPGTSSASERLFSTGGNVELVKGPPLSPHL